jgi:hypothetical protein
MSACVLSYSVCRSWNALHSFIYQWLYSPLLDPGLSFSFVTFFTQKVDGGSARRKAATYEQNNTNRKNAYIGIHDLGGNRTHDPSSRASEAVHGLDRAATVLLHIPTYPGCQSSESYFGKMTMKECNILQHRVDAERQPKTVGYGDRQQIRMRSV